MAPSSARTAAVVTPRAPSPDGGAPYPATCSSRAGYGKHHASAISRDASIGRPRAPLPELVVARVAGLERELGDDLREDLLRHRVVAGLRRVGAAGGDAR